MHTAPPPAPVTDITVDEVITGRLVQPVFQPIVELSTRTVTGLEALARGPAGTALQFPDRLFAAARAAGRLGELDMLCSERALEIAVAAAVPPPLLFVNAEPEVIGQSLSPRLVELVSGGLPFREILEFTERALPAAPGSMMRIAGLVQRWGNGLALDDVGVEPMSLAFLPILEPEVIKLDMSLVRDPDSAHARTVSAVVRAEAQRTGAVVIAEGIETEADLDSARRLGAGWGQGWLFGRPQPIEQATRHFHPSPSSALRPPRPGFHQAGDTPFQAAVRGVCRTASAVPAALDRLRDMVAVDDTAVLLASCPGDDLPGAGEAMRDLAGRAGSYIPIEPPIPGEFAAAVIGPGYGHAVCVRTGDAVQVLTADDLPTVAAVSRALLRNRS